MIRTLGSPGPPVAQGGRWGEVLPRGLRPLATADRAARRGKRPVREAVGVDLRLTEQWSKRSAVINAELDRRTAQFLTDHGREPTPSNLYDLAQEATLKTREQKLKGRTRAEERAQWRRDAEQLLGADAVRIMLAASLNHPTPDRAPLDAREVAAQVVSRVAETRATWQINHLRSETERQFRGRIDPHRWATLLDEVLDAALSPAPVDPAWHPGPRDRARGAGPQRRHQRLHPDPRPAPHQPRHRRR